MEKLRHFGLFCFAQILKYILKFKTTNHKNSVNYNNSVNCVMSSTGTLFMQRFWKAAALYSCTGCHDIILPSYTGCDMPFHCVCLMLSPDPFPSLKHMGDPNNFSMWWSHTGFPYGKSFTIFIQKYSKPPFQHFIQLPVFLAY